MRPQKRTRTTQHNTNTNTNDRHQFITSIILQQQLLLPMLLLLLQQQQQPRVRVARSLLRKPCSTTKRHNNQRRHTATPPHRHTANGDFPSHLTSPHLQSLSVATTDPVLCWVDPSTISWCLNMWLPLIHLLIKLFSRFFNDCDIVSLFCNTII